MSRDVIRVKNSLETQVTCESPRACVRYHDSRVLPSFVLVSRDRPDVLADEAAVPNRGRSRCSSGSLWRPRRLQGRLCFTMFMTSSDCVRGVGYDVEAHARGSVCAAFAALVQPPLLIRMAVSTHLLHPTRCSSSLVARPSSARETSTLEDLIPCAQEWSGDAETLDR